MLEFVVALKINWNEIQPSDQVNLNDNVSDPLMDTLMRESNWNYENIYESISIKHFN
jgi:hypothetical protein